MTQKNKSRTFRLVSHVLAVDRGGAGRVPVVCNQAEPPPSWSPSRSAMGRPLPPRPASAAVPSSVWRTVDASVVVALPPAALAGGRAGVAAAAAAASLEPALLRYVPPLGGVVVAALPRAGAGRGGASGTGVMAVEPAGHLPAASAYVHVRGRVSLLVFSPPSGALLRGVVNFIVWTVGTGGLADTRLWTDMRGRSGVAHERACLRCC